MQGVYAECGHKSRPAEVETATAISGIEKNGQAETRKRRRGRHFAGADRSAMETATGSHAHKFARQLIQLGSFKVRDRCRLRAKRHLRLIAAAARIFHVIQE